MKFLILFTIILIVGCNSEEYKKTGLNRVSIPSFKLLLIDNTTLFDSKEIPRNKPSVLFYYSPNCPYCRAQMAEIIDKMEKLHHIQFYLITNSSIKDMKIFYNKFQLSKYSNVTIGKDSSNALATHFKIRGVPYIVVYGKNRMLSQIFEGKTYINDIEKAASY